MALGTQVAEVKSKTTSRRIVEVGAGPTRVELNNEGMATGKLAGMVMTTVTVTQHPDGTGVAEAKIGVMGPEGEMASGRSMALGVMTNGKVTIRGIVQLHSDHPKWAWLNNTALAMESTADMQTGEEHVRLYEWK